LIFLDIEMKGEDGLVSRHKLYPDSLTQLLFLRFTIRVQFTCVFCPCQWVLFTP